MYEQLVALRYQKDPVIAIWEEESESQWVSGVKDDKVVHDLNNRATGHVSCDKTCTWIEVTQLS